MLRGSLCLWKSNVIKRLMEWSSSSGTLKVDRDAWGTKKVSNAQKVKQNLVNVCAYDNIYSSWNTLYIVFDFGEGLINEFWKISVVCRAGVRGLPWNWKEHSRVCRAVNTNKRYKNIQSKDSTRGKEVHICSTLYICSRSWTRSRGMRAAPMHHHLMQCLPLKALLAKLGLKMFRTDI